MITIREATADDASAIQEISTNDLGYPCQKKLVQYRLEHLDCSRERVFVAVDEQKVIGFIQAEVYNLLYQPSSINVLGLAVAQAYRGYGAGRLLMEKAEQWAKQQNINKVRLNSASQRENAHQFYQHLGYKNTKTQKRFTKEL